jgi:hypothetical protein
MPGNVPTSAVETRCRSPTAARCRDRHRADDAEHRRDDAGARQRIGHLLHRVRGLERLVAVRFGFVPEQRLRLVRIRIAAPQAQATGDEVEHLMLAHGLRVLFEDRAGCGSSMSASTAIALRGAA